MRLRHSVRGLLVDHDDRLLLYRFTVPGGGPTVWTPPGGGIEAGETLLEALARELDEETGLRELGVPVHVWHQEVADPTVLAGWDGVVNDYFLITTPAFEPMGSLGPTRLAAELVGDFAWWEPARLLSHRGPEVFGPRELPRLFADLLHLGPRAAPVQLGR